jgi:hypothetical protein
MGSVGAIQCHTNQSADINGIVMFAGGESDALVNHSKSIMERDYPSPVTRPLERGAFCMSAFRS